MHVIEILGSKGREVATVRPTDTVASVVERLAEKGIGALVVSIDGGSIDGIVSERDVVRALASEGPALLDAEVSTIMTAQVWTCAASDTVEQLMSRMTEHRIRHLPVEADGVLDGIISIGDVVKSRVTELDEEARHLQGYIQSSGYS